MISNLRTILVCALVLFGFSSTLLAAKFVRWTGFEDDNPSFTHILQKVQTLTGYNIKAEDFKIGEDRALAFSTYTRHDQHIADTKVRYMSIRLWKDNDGRLIQLEANIEDPKDYPKISIMHQPNIKALEKIAVQSVRSSTDHEITDISHSRVFYKKVLVDILKLTGKRGIHEIIFNSMNGAIIEASYKEHPNADVQTEAEFSLPARVYPIYEEFNGELLERKNVELKYLNKQISRSTEDPYLALQQQRYYSKKRDAEKASTKEGRDEGYWSKEWLSEKAAQISSQLPVFANDFQNGGVSLQGRYATVSIHPEAFTKFENIEIDKIFSTQLMFSWQKDEAVDDHYIIPRGAILGKPIASIEEAAQRSAARHPQHDGATYINNGFDEIQVYYAINTLFDALRPMGFTDPDISERPFHAFLFNPDIGSRDNAFYTNDTINFTTYSSSHMNFARDNTTIWHELGHGLMDRMMGDYLKLADTGGLSEGIADFVAEMVIQSEAFGESFPGRDNMRINNLTGYYLTNEVHDDGEAYGGTLKAIMDRAIDQFGKDAVHKVSDLILEAMRLCRDHPALTVDEWYKHVLFADQLGRKDLRAPSELKEIIEDSFALRSFANEPDRANFQVFYNNEEVVSGKQGSRGNGIKAELTAEEKASYEITVKVTEGKSFKFGNPFIIKVFFNDGPLQGAIKWIGEENGPLEFTVDQVFDDLKIPLAIAGVCDRINQDDGSCSDYVYIQIWQKDASLPVAKKRFYVHLRPM